MAKMRVKQEPLDMTCTEKKYSNKTIVRDISIKEKLQIFRNFDASVNYGCNVNIKEESYSDDDGDIPSEIIPTSNYFEPLELMVKRNHLSIAYESVVKNECEMISSKHSTSGHIINLETDAENAISKILYNETNISNSLENFSELNKLGNSDDHPAMCHFSLFKNTSRFNYFDTKQDCIISANLTGKKLYDFSRNDFKRRRYRKVSDRDGGNISAYICDVCNHVSKRLSDLNSHKTTHSEETPYVCEECGYTCRKLSNLKSHRQTHTGEKPFVCDECGYSSNFFNNLKTHKIIHTGEKPFSCPECSYTCGRPSNLKRHMLKHSQVRTFACDQCSYMSKDVTGLKVHKLVHTGTKPHVCQVCASSYVTLKSLNHHKKKHFNLKLAS